MKRRRPKKPKKGNHEDVAGIRYTRYIPTPDDWYPTFDDGTVRVQVSNNTKLWKTPAIRVSVWGNDDDGMEKDHHFDTEKEARSAFYHLVRTVNNWAIVSKQMLRDLGFIRA